MNPPTLLQVYLCFSKSCGSFIPSPPSRRCICLLFDLIYIIPATSSSPSLLLNILMSICGRRLWSTMYRHRSVEARATTVATSRLSKYHIPERNVQILHSLLSKITTTRFPSSLTSRYHTRRIGQISRSSWELYLQRLRNTRMSFSSTPILIIN